MQKPDLPDLDAMELDELWAIHEELTKILSDRILGEKRELEKRLAKLNQADPSVVEGHGSSHRPHPPRRKYPKVLPKYFNPSEPSETWSGRGKQPRWLTLALQAGHALEEFEIKKADEDGDHDWGTDEEPPS
ncbi:Trans-acting regulatory protein HvrA [Afipia felis]